MTVNMIFPSPSASCEWSSNANSIKASDIIHFISLRITRMGRSRREKEFAEGDFTTETQRTRRGTEDEVGDFGGISELYGATRYSIVLVLVLGMITPRVHILPTRR